MGSRSILFSTFGSKGDLFPFLALATAMQQRGYQVAIASSRHHRGVIEHNGIRFWPTAPDCDFADPVFQRRALNEVTGGRFLLRDTIFPQIRASYADLFRAAEGYSMLVTQTLSYAGPLVAEKTGIPWVSAVLTPYSFFSHTDSPILASRLGRLRETLPWLNCVVNRAARFSTRSWSEPVRLLRQELGLAAGAEPIFEGQHFPLCVLAMFSSIFATLQADWPLRVLITGFPFWEETSASAEVSSLIEEFWQVGPEPLVFTLGSSAVLDPGSFYQESVKAARKLGRRAILLGWPRELERPSGSDLLMLRYAPHALVFQRACAVVHSGGIGTTAHALRASCPTLVVPWAYDQPDNALRLARLGVSRTISRNRYTAGRAASELDALLSKAGYQESCSHIADHVQSEDGVEAACSALESCLRHERPVLAGR